MQELVNPLTRAIYGVDPDTGLVRVTDKNQVGLFTAKGEWKSGDVFDVCPHMCMWVGGPNPERGSAYTTSFRQI